MNHYTGTVFFVSHDRYFINKTAHRILDLSNGVLTNYLGNYDYYIEKRTEQETVTPADTETVSKEKAETENKQDWQKQKQEQARRRKIANELQKVEAEIEMCEQKITEIDEQCQDPAIAVNSAKLNELGSERAVFSEKLEALYEQWEVLSEDS